METFPQIIIVKDQRQGLNCAREILYRESDNQTLLFLSGGSTPRQLYQTLAKEKRLKAKDVGMVDERGDRSNFEMIAEAGLLTYLKNAKINFYPIDSSFSYDKKIHDLIESSKNRIAIMGIGEDGHTAGLPSEVSHFVLQRRTSGGKQNYVTKINNFPGKYKERITLTFEALSEMDLLIILAFGENKKGALQKMFEKGPIEEIPARFYIRPEIAAKTLLITDQKV